FGQKSGYTFFGPPANAVLSVYDLGSSPNSAGGKAFVTGVVYNDTLNDNNFYDAGEGLGGVSILAVPTPGGSGGVAASISTFSTGGYSLPLDPGTYDITISGGGLSAPLVYNRVAV